MGRGSWVLSARALFCCLLLLLFQRDCRAQICSVPDSTATVPENQPAGTLVLTITAEPNVNFNLQANPGNFFRLQGANVVINTPLDFETSPREIEITIRCTHSDQRFLNIDVIIIVENVNDVAPEFAQSHYNLNVAELSRVDSTVGEVAATDVEQDLLYYYMVPENEYFKLKSVNNPTILVKKHIDYDVVQNVSFTLLVVDTRSPPPPDVNSYNDTATVTISVIDVDNRPPWFQPCVEETFGSSTICLGPGYRGKVNLTEKTEGVLPLEPGPLFAIDGDRGLREQIIYRIVGENEPGIFALDENTGNITMLKAADVPGPVVLTVLALQLLNNDQFARTSVTFDVVLKSQNAPQFQKPLYAGFVFDDSGPNSLVWEDESKSTPLRVQATDADFSDGVNPELRYNVEDDGGGSFMVTAEGFLLLTRTLEPGTVSFRVRAVDTSNGEFNLTTVSVEVIPGPTTALPTTAMPTTTMPTTAMATTGVGNVTTPDSNSTVSMTTQSQEDTARTEPGPGPPPMGPGGRYGGSDMAALGASLGVLLLLCLVVIGLLLVRMKKGDAAWKKLSEASLFRSMLVRGSGLKEGVQYTNSGFQNDGDSGSVTSDLPAKMEAALQGAANGRVGQGLGEALGVLEAGGARIAGTPPDAGSLAESDRADSEREVRPILTKERRMEEGYKSVWFKEDIDPDAKEEVRIIPDSRERDAEEEEEEEEEDEEESVDGEDGEEGSPPPTPSALRIKGAVDSEEEEDDSDL